MIVFPWLPVLNISKLDVKGFVLNLLSLQWNPEDTLMLGVISPWKKYIDDKNWNILIGFGIAPRLLHLLYNFEISASSNNAKNLNKLKALIRYSELLSAEQVSAIL